MDIDFHCTKCGACCRELWLPLSISEAAEWLDRGHAVDILCEAIPWPDELPASNRQAIFKRARSFPARSGALPIRVLVTLAAPQGHGCPHLGSDQLCAIYENRPAICRVYPAEGNPFLVLDPSRRRCPPECWGSGGKAYLRDSRYVDADLRKLVHKVRDRAVIETESLQRICQVLEVKVAAVANEGYVVHSPTPAMLRTAIVQRHARVDVARDWRFVTNRMATLEALGECMADALPDGASGSAAFRYVSLFANQP